MGVIKMLANLKEQEEQEYILQKNVIENQRFIHKLDELVRLVDEIHNEFDVQEDYDFSDDIHELLVEAITT
jgi:hypothetical protein